MSVRKVAPPRTPTHYGRCPYCRFMHSVEEFQEQHKFNCGSYTMLATWFRSPVCFEIERLKRHRTKLRKLLRDIRKGEAE